MLWSLARSLPFAADFENCDHYAINVLAEDQQDLSQRFASRLEDKFAGLAFSEGLGGAPLLDGCCARFECRNTVRHPGGDHVVFISRSSDSTVPSGRRWSFTRVPIAASRESR